MSSVRSGVNSHMSDKMGGLSKHLTAYFAFVGFLSGMCPIVGDQVSRLRETFLTLTALVRLFTAVHPLVKC